MTEVRTRTEKRKKYGIKIWEGITGKMKQESSMFQNQPSDEKHKSDYYKEIQNLSLFK